MSNRKSRFYDDFDDEDDWYEDDFEDEHDIEPEVAKPTAKPSAKTSKVSSLSTIKSSAEGKKLPQAESIRAASHPLVPEAASTAAVTAGLQRFKFDQPSPDDVVLNAQQGRRDATPPESSAAASGTPVQEQGNALGTVASSEAVRGQGQQKAAKRPLSEYKMEADLAQECERAAAHDSQSGGRPKLHLVVLGHVDAGKSTLMGRMLYELGLITDKAVHRTQRDAAAAGKGSFAWAWMLDERPEERARGVTVDVAMTRFQTLQRSVTLLDAPGHRDFVPNMISGAAQADAALLVVDGSPGGFEAGFQAAVPGSEGGGQTREHAQLARSLGVEQVAVVVTKLDVCDFDQQRFEFVRSTLDPFLRTCGFRESSVQWLPAVAPTGDNLAKPPADPRLSAWWSGPTLAEAIDRFRPAHRLVEKPLRLPVADVQKSGKTGVVVGGKLEGGALKPGTVVLVMPSKQEATVKSVEVDGQAAPLARAGDSADVTLASIDTSAVAAGSVLCHPGYPVPLVSKFEARVVVLDVTIPVLRGQQVTLHAHTARESGHISGLVSLLNSKSGEVIRTKPRCLLKGQTAVVEVTPSRPICLEDYSDYRALGRVALREGGRTVAVGIITALTGYE